MYTRHICLKLGWLKVESNNTDALQYNVWQPGVAHHLGPTSHCRSWRGSIRLVLDGSPVRTEVFGGDVGHGKQQASEDQGS